MKSSRPMWTEEIGVCRWRFSGVKCGIEPREEVAMNEGSGRDHLRDAVARAISVREGRWGRGVDGAEEEKEEEEGVDILRRMRGMWRRGVDARKRGVRRKEMLDTAVKN